MKNWLFVIISLIGHSGFAGSCEYENLSAYFKTPYDQQDIGWCYAYSAADLINFKFREQLKGRAVSPTHLAMLYNANLANRFNQDGGSTYEAIGLGTYRANLQGDSVFGKGLCYDDVDKNIFSAKQGISLRNQFLGLSKLKQDYDAFKSTSSRVSFAEANLKSILSNPLTSVLDPQALFQILEFSNSKSVGINLLNQYCPVASRFFPPEKLFPTRIYLGGTYSYIPNKGATQYIPIKQPKQLLEFVHQQLDSKNVSTISYFSGFLQTESANDEAGDVHASTVVGRQEIGGKCHIIVRNSWGRCVNAKGKNIYSRNVTKCEDGYIWIDENKLVQKLTHVTFVK